jgi:hypothetical protein
VNEQKQIDDLIKGGGGAQQVNDLQEQIFKARKQRACDRACAGEELLPGQREDFGDIVAAIEARDEVDVNGNPAGDGGQQLEDVCKCGNDIGGNDGGNDDGGNAVVPENLVAVPPGTPGNGEHVRLLLALLGAGEFEDMSAPGPNGAPGLQNPVEANGEDLAFNAPEWRDAMDGLREFWDGINVQRKADGEPLILFPAIPDPRSAFFPAQPAQPAIPAGVWGPQSPNNPANAGGAAPRRVA